MVKNVYLIIGCVILSLSATLIVPTSCSPIVENEQTETNLGESRSKRSVTTDTASASASASANSVTKSQVSNQLFSLLLPYLLSVNPVIKTMAPNMVNPNNPNGLAGILQGLNPALDGILGPLITFLSKTVGGLGNTLGFEVSGIGDNLLDPLTGGLGGLLGNVFGGIGRGGGSTPPIAMPMPTPLKSINPYALIAALVDKSSQISESSAATSASSTTTVSKTQPIKLG